MGGGEEAKVLRGISRISRISSRLASSASSKLMVSSSGSPFSLPQLPFPLNVMASFDPTMVCSSVLSPQNELTIFNPDRLPSDVLGGISEVFSRAVGLFGNDKFPDVIPVVVYGLGRNALYNPAGTIYTAAYRLHPKAPSSMALEQKPNQYGPMPHYNMTDGVLAELIAQGLVDPDQRRGIVASVHELGHMLQRCWMSRDPEFPYRSLIELIGFDALLTNIKQLGGSTYEWLERYKPQGSAELVKWEEVRAKLTAGGSKTFLATVQMQREELVGRIKGTFPQLEPFLAEGMAEMFIIQATLPYAEFFADLVAALFYRDPGVVAKNLVWPQLDGEKPHDLTADNPRVFGRSFTASLLPDPNALGNWHAIKRDPHIALAPARVAMEPWLDEVFCTDPSEQQDAIRNLLRAAYEAIKACIIDNSPLSPGFSGSTANPSQQLIEEFEARL